MAIAIAIAYYAVVSIIVGVVSSRKSKSSDTFTKSEGGLNWIMLTFAFVLIPLGAGHTLNLWESAYTLGASTLWWGIITGGIFLPLMMIFFGPWMRETGLPSFPAIMEKIFGPAMGKLQAGVTVATWTGIGAAETIATGTAIYGLSGGANGIFGGNVRLCYIIAVVLILIYVLFGGILQMAVLNMVNAIVMIVGSYLALGLVGLWMAANYGGWTHVLNFFNEAEKLTFLQNFDFSPGIMFQIIIPVLVLHVTAAAVAPNNTIPFFAARSDADCRKGVFLGAAINGMASIPWVAIALTGASIPVLVDRLNAAGVSVARFIPIELGIEALPTPVLAIMMIALLAASLSTGGSVVLGNGAVLAKDIVEKSILKNLGEKGKMINLRVCMILCCLFFAIPALTADVVFPVFLWCFSFSIPLFVVYIMGLWVKISRTAAWITVIVTYIVNFWWTFWTPGFIPEGSPLALNMYPVTIVSVVLGIILPLVLPGETGLLRAKRANDRLAKAAK